MTRLYAAALRLLPADFRRQFAAGMIESFERRRQRLRGAARVRFVVAAFADLLTTAVAERTPRGASLRIPGGASDLRGAVRAIGARPGFALAVIGTLAIGVGANVAVFGLADSVLWWPLPVERPDRVVEFFTTHGADDPGGYGLDDGLSYPEFRTLAARARTLQSVAGFIDVSVGFDAGIEARQLTAAAVSANYFSLLGVRPALGRLLDAAGDRDSGATHVVVISHRLWTETFGRSGAVLGQSVRIGGTPFEVVGVTTAGFRGTRLADEPDVWVPMAAITDIRAGGIWNGPLGKRMLGDHPLGWVSTLGRLMDGASLGAAQDEARAMFPAPPHAPGDLGGEQQIIARPLAESAAIVDRAALVRLLAILGAVVGLTLFVACLNVANLTWARTAERARELAVRTAIGASRRRLVWQLLLESMLLALAGAAAAFLVSAVMTRVLAAHALPGGIHIATIAGGFSPRSAVVAAALAILSAVLIGLAPALRASRPRLVASLRTTSAVAGRQRGTMLVAGQVAATLVLLVTATLFLRSLERGLHTDLGFNPRQLSAVSVDLFRYGYDRRTVPAYYRAALERVAALPEVTGAALTSHLPLGGVGTMAFDAPGSSVTPEKPLKAGITSVTPDFFQVLGTPVIAGRTFADTDTAPAPPVSVINEAAARAFFGGASALGREIRIYGAKSSTVIGVVADGKYASVTERGRPMVYLSFFQELPSGGVAVVARSARPAATLPLLREAVQHIDDHVALYDARVVSAQVDAALAPQRFGTMLLGIFALVGLAVAGLGVYSVVGCAVAQRTPELGLRRALGAGAFDVVRVVLLRIGAAVALGLIAGVAASIPAARALQGFMVDVSPVDGWAFAVALALLTGAAVLAMAGPARRAVRTDPLITLRSQ